MSARKITGILDAAAAVIAGAFGVAEISRDPIGAEEGEPDPASDVRMVAALSEGETTVLDELMTASEESFEIQHDAAFELIAVGDDDATRKANAEDALMRAHAAVAVDPTLGGVCDYARFEEPDPDMQDRYVALAARLVITYTAPSALG